MLATATMAMAPDKPDETTIRNILEEEVAAWNKGDADAYSRYFATDGTFTNLLGMFFTGRDAFRKRHDQICKGAYRGSTKQEDIVSLKVCSHRGRYCRNPSNGNGLSKAPSRNRCR
jgi:ketosteroid isomerase-like protein